MNTQGFSSAAGRSDIPDGQDASGAVYDRSSGPDIARILSGINHSVFVMDPQDRIVFHNAMFRQLWRVTPEEMAEHPTMFDLLTKLFFSGRYPPVPGVTTEDEFRAFLEARLAPLRAREIEPVQLNIRGKVYRVTGARVDEWRIINHVDITDLEEARKLAEAASHAKSDFLSNMSHEIRTPMNGIVGMCDVLMETSLTDEQRFCAQTISESSSALLRIINDILDFSKIEAGKFSLFEEPFSLVDLVYDVASLLQGPASKKGIELCVDYEDGLPVGYVGDSGRVRQVLLNIVGNAVKFTEAGYVLVRVHAAEPGGFEISVKDTGIGIPADKLDHVFHAFEQADTATTRKFVGSGLGLAISRDLVELMGGTVRVQSQEGQGSTFSLTLDLPVAEEKSALPPVPEDGLKGANILVVDDLHINRSILDKQLTRAGAQVVLAEGQAEAEAALKTCGRVDLAIFDYQMPEHDGLALLERFRDTPEHKDVPVVLLSSVDSAFSRADLMARGFARVLLKPIRKEHLLRVLSRLFGSTEQDFAAKQMFVSEDARQIDLVGVSVLVAEDNRTNQLVLTKMLGGTGVSLKLCDNGALAVEAFKGNRPDMVLMDVSMPVLNGLEATRQIREFEADGIAPRCPIVALTANAMPHQMAEALSAGMDGFLSKPVRKADLLAKVSELLAASWLEQSDAGEIASLDPAVQSRLGGEQPG